MRRLLHRFARKGDMKYLEAFIIVNIWAILCSLAMSKGAEISSDAQVLSCAIVIAGVLAGNER